MNPTTVIPANPFRHPGEPLRHPAGPSVIPAGPSVIPADAGISEPSDRSAIGSRVEPGMTR